MSNNVDGYIRIPKVEFERIDTSKQFFTHFNLEKANHEVGKRYGLVEIISHGYFDGVTEVPPVLSYEHMIIAECVEARIGITYADLSETDFEFSLPDIQNREQLNERLFERYRPSRKNLSDEEIRNSVISLTKLKFVTKG